MQLSGNSTNLILWPQPPWNQSQSNALLPWNSLKVPQMVPHTECTLTWTTLPTGFMHWHCSMKIASGTKKGGTESDFYTFNSHIASLSNTLIITFSPALCSLIIPNPSINHPLIQVTSPTLHLSYLILATPLFSPFLPTLAVCRFWPFNHFVHS